MPGKKVKAIPEGFHTVTPYLAQSDAAKAVEFYKKAFGAEVLMVMPGPGGKLGHAQLRIGDSMIMMSDEMPQGQCKSPATLKGTTASLFLYVQDVDAAFKRATDAGCKAVMPPQDMFWGDRFASLADPFGHLWSIATHKEDLTPQEMQKRHDAFAAQMSGGESKKKK
jgi:PhnB protein